MAKGFGEAVTVVAFGGTHRAMHWEGDGVLWFNPGSPNLPSDKQGHDDLGSVAVLEVSDGKPSVEIIRLKA
jgi:predicted phosphodiesterase